MNTDLDKLMYLENKLLDLCEKRIIEAKDEGHSPNDCTPMTAATIKMIVLSMIKIRSTMISNMHQSGQHEYDPMLNTQSAIKTQGLFKIVSPFGQYYFYMLCTVYMEIDQRYLHKSTITDSTETININNDVKDKYLSPSNNAKKISSQIDSVQTIINKIDDQMINNNMTDMKNE